METRYEQIVDSSPTEAQATRDELGLASYVHRMGLPGDLRSATYFQRELAKAGWDAKLVEYDVPIAYPTTQRLTLLGPKPRELDLYEPAVPGDPYSRDHASVGKPYSGYSADGDVTGPIVYANQATPADFDQLAKMHVDVRGAILVARVGGGALTAKAFEGAKHGAKAVLIFPDPMNGGYWNGDVYPDGPYRSLGGALRNTMTFTNDPGDPTAIGIPVPGAPHKPFSAIKLPSIPEMPITGYVARDLLQAMDGQAVPPDWHPGFAFAVHTGATARAHFVIKSKRFFGPIWDVIATMPGVQPEQMVVVGGHRDAWTYGAVDPISGTVDMLQLGRAFGKLKATGWKPQRTIVIGSWDGEELNLFGSEEWVEQHERELHAGCVAYVNTDEVAFGPRFFASATAELRGLLRDVASVAHAPDGTLLDAYWKAQDSAQPVSDVGNGSDHEPFVYHEALPAAAGGYGGPFGTYHSAYDDPASLRVLDPGMHRAAAAARFTGLVVLRLADATYPDERLGDFALGFRDHVSAFAKAKGSETRRAAVVAKLQPDIEAFIAAANELDARADDAISKGDTATAASLYQKLRAAESAFFDASSTHWARSLYYGLDLTLDPTTGDAALQQLDAAVQAATQAATP